MPLSQVQAQAQISSLQEIVTSLRKGQKWLTESFRDWLAGGEFTQVDQQRFDAGMAKWEGLERLFQTTNPTACIWGSNKKCPIDAPVVCGPCESPSLEPVTE